MFYEVLNTYIPSISFLLYIYIYMWVCTVCVCTVFGKGAGGGGASERTQEFLMFYEVPHCS